MQFQRFFSFSRPAAFTLIEMAAVLLLVSLMAGFGMQALQATTATDCYAKSREQLSTIRDALTRFVDNNDRLPIPAGRSLSVSSPMFGREDTPADAALASGGAIDRLTNWGVWPGFVLGGVYNSSGTLQSTGAAGTGTHDYADNVLFGALPFQALQLPMSYASDCWGNKFSYVVAENFTTSYNYETYTSGPLQIYRGLPTANPIAKTAGYVVLSHGEDGLGAVSQNYSGASHGWCANSSTRLDSQNCDITDRYYTLNDLANGKGSSGYYDDLLIYNQRPVFTGPIFCWGYDGTPSGYMGDGRTDPYHFSTGYAPNRAHTNAVFSRLSENGTNGKTPCALQADGTAYCWGTNTYGQVGDGSTATRNVPVPVNTTVKFEKTYAFGNYNCGLQVSTHNAYCWGWNGGYTLAIGSTLGCGGVAGCSAKGLNNTTPIQVAGGHAFASLAGGDYFTCGLTLDAVSAPTETTPNQIFCWGTKNSGISTQGLDSYNTAPDTRVPTAVAGGHTFSMLAGVGGGSSFCGLTTTGDPKPGRIYCWGSGSTGIFYGAVLGRDLIPISSITPASTSGTGALVTTTVAHGLTTGDNIFLFGVSGTGAMQYVNYQSYYVMDSGTYLTTNTTRFHLCKYNGSPTGLTCNPSTPIAPAYGYDYTGGAYSSGGVIEVIRANAPREVDAPAGTTFRWIGTAYGETGYTAIDTNGHAWLWGSHAQPIDGNGTASPYGAIYSGVSITPTTGLVTTGSDPLVTAPGSWTTSPYYWPTSVPSGATFTQPSYPLVVGDTVTVSGIKCTAEPGPPVVGCTQTNLNGNNYRVGLIVGSTITLKNLDGSSIGVLRGVYSGSGTITRLQGPGEGLCVNTGDANTRYMCAPSQVTGGPLSTANVAEFWVNGNDSRAAVRTNTGNYYVWGASYVGDNSATPGTPTFTPSALYTTGLSLTGPITPAYQVFCLGTTLTTATNQTYCWGNQASNYGAMAGTGSVTAVKIPTLVTGGYHFIPDALTGGQSLRSFSTGVCAIASPGE